ILHALEGLQAVAPVTMIAHEMAASLMYWVGCHCDRVVATATAMVGSVGVIAGVMDDSKFMDELGIRMVYATTARAKLIGNMGVAIDDELRAMMDEEVLPVGRRFAEAVAANRNMKVEDVVALDGRCYD